MTTNTRTKVHQLVTPAGMLDFFQERFDITHAADSELQYLANCSSAICCMASSLSSLTEGIGTLIDGDRLNERQRPDTEALQGDAQAALLYHIATEIELIAQMSEIAFQANWQLQKRLIDRLKVERSRRAHGDEYSSRENSDG